MFSLLLALTAQPVTGEQGPTDAQSPSMEAQAEGFRRRRGRDRVDPSMGFQGPPVSRDVATELIEPLAGIGMAQFTDRLGRTTRTEERDGSVTHIWEEYVTLGGGYLTNGIGGSTGSFRQEQCSLRVTWNADDVISNWSINGQQTACDRILRWLR